MSHYISAALVGALASLGLAVPADATTPGRNGLIVYSADAGGTTQLFTVRPDGSHVRQITQVAGDAVHADWSPDGRRIAFELDADGALIRIVDADGSHPRDLTVDGFEGQPAFTPDGRHIVFERLFPDNGDDGIWIMRTDGSHLRRLTTSPFPETGSDTDPNVSPDGRVVTFVRIQQNQVLQALFAVDIDGSNLRQLTPYALDVGIKHDWAPNGRRIAIISLADSPAPGDSSNVATIRADGSGLRAVTDYAGGEVTAVTGSYSPNGRWIVYRVEDHGTGSFALWKVHPDGSDPRQILSLPVPPRYIDWGSRPDA